MNHDLQEEMFIKYLDGVVHNKKVSHAYLIEINDYDKDICYIYNFIKMILCNMSYHDAVNCDNDICRLIDEGNFPDIKIISSDSSVIKKEQMLDLQRDYSNKSLYGNQRFYIIKDAWKLNAASANTILKFLEEPSPGVIAFLLTDNRYHVLDTILSRCQILSLNNDVCYEYDDNLLDFLDLLLSPSKLFINYKEIISTYLTDKKVSIDCFERVEDIIVEHINSNDRNKDVSLIFRNKSNEYLLNVISILEDELPKLRFNVNFKLWLDCLFSRLLEVSYD